MISKFGMISTFYFDGTYPVACSDANSFFPETGPSSEAARGGVSRGRSVTVVTPTATTCRGWPIFQYGYM